VPRTRFADDEECLSPVVSRRRRTGGPTFPVPFSRSPSFLLRLLSGAGSGRIIAIWEVGAGMWEGEGGPPPPRGVPDHALSRGPLGYSLRGRSFSWDTWRVLTKSRGEIITCNINAEGFVPSRPRQPSTAQKCKHAHNALPILARISRVICSTTTDGVGNSHPGRHRRALSSLLPPPPFLDLSAHIVIPRKGLVRAPPGLPTS
jgi:hypothetical protein